MGELLWAYSILAPRLVLRVWALCAFICARGSYACSTFPIRQPLASAPGLAAKLHSWGSVRVLLAHGGAVVAWTAFGPWTLIQLLSSGLVRPSACGAGSRGSLANSLQRLQAPSRS